MPRTQQHAVTAVQLPCGTQSHWSAQGACPVTSAGFVPVVSRGRANVPRTSSTSSVQEMDVFDDPASSPPPPASLVSRHPQRNPSIAARDSGRHTHCDAGGRASLVPVVQTSVLHRLDPKHADAARGSLCSDGDDSTCEDEGSAVATAASNRCASIHRRADLVLHLTNSTIPKPDDNRHSHRSSDYAIVAPPLAAVLGTAERETVVRIPNALCAADLALLLADPNGPAAVPFENAPSAKLRKELSHATGSQMRDDLNTADDENEGEGAGAVGSRVGDALLRSAALEAAWPAALVSTPSARPCCLLQYVTRCDADRQSVLQPLDANSGGLGFSESSGEVHVRLAACLLLEATPQTNDTASALTGAPKESHAAQWCSNAKATPAASVASSLQVLVSLAAPHHHTFDEDVLQVLVHQPLHAAVALRCALLCVPSLYRHLERVVHSALLSAAGESAVEHRRGPFAPEVREDRSGTFSSSVRSMRMHDVALSEQLRYLAPLTSLRDTSTVINAAFANASTRALQRFLMDVTTRPCRIREPRASVVDCAAALPLAVDNTAPPHQSGTPMHTPDSNMPTCILDSTDSTDAAVVAEFLRLAPYLFRSLLSDNETIATLRGVAMRSASLGVLHDHELRSASKRKRLNMAAHFVLACVSWLYWSKDQRCFAFRLRSVLHCVSQQVSQLAVSWAECVSTLASLLPPCSTGCAPWEPSTEPKLSNSLDSTSASQWSRWSEDGIQSCSGRLSASTAKLQRKRSHVRGAGAHSSAASTLPPTVVNALLNLVTRLNPQCSV